MCLSGVHTVYNRLNIIHLHGYIDTHTSISISHMHAVYCIRCTCMHMCEGCICNVPYVCIYSYPNAKKRVHVWLWHPLPKKLCLKVSTQNARVNCINDFGSGGVTYIEILTVGELHATEWCSVRLFNCTYPAPPLQHFADPQGLNQTNLSREQWLHLERNNNRAAYDNFALCRLATQIFARMITYHFSYTDRCMSVHAVHG